MSVDNSRKKKTLEQFKKEVYDILGEDYEVIGEYINNKTKIEMFHKECDKYYMARPHDIKQKGTRCPHCFGNFKKTLSDLKNELPKEFEYLDSFVSYSKPANFRCLKCDHIYNTNPTYIVRGRKCPKCTGIKKLSNDEFLERIEKLDFREEYEFLDEYVNMNTKIRVIHSECNFEYKVSPSHFIRGRRCPNCHMKMSQNEKRIKNFLDNNNISYKMEYYFKNFKTDLDRYYRFDFFIEDSNTLIEYDGMQHFKNFNIFTNESVERTKVNDRIKNKWALDNNIRLIRISYRYENINKILTDILLNNDVSSETIENYKMLLIDNGKIINEDNYYSE